MGSIYLDFIRVHHSRINDAIDEFRQAAVDCGIKGYQPAQNGQPAVGEIRYLQLTLERSSQKVQLVIVWHASMYKDVEGTLPRLVKRLKSTRPDLWHSITVNFQMSESNVIFNYNEKSWKLMWGPPAIKEKVGNADFFFRPQFFRQANLDMFESHIIPLVARSIPDGSRVSELYSGVGVLGLNVASRAAEVLCSDSNNFVDEVFKPQH